MILGVNGKRLVGPAKTASYKPFTVHTYWDRPRDLPVFDFRMMRRMLCDSTVRLGLAMRMAPLMQAEFAYKEGEEWTQGIKADNPDVAEWILEQLHRFWKHELHKMLRAQVWGWSAAEMIYRLVDGKVEIDRSLHRHSADVFALHRDGEVGGVKFTRIGRVGTVRLKFPECYWHAFQTENESPYGESILWGAYTAWCDKQLEGGATDVRRLFMHKDAFGGAKMGYPEGNTDIGTGDPVPNRDIARQIVEQRLAGSVLTYPSTRDINGNEMWPFEEATIASNPQHILQYPKDLDVEILRGLEIPDDVLTSEASGAWQGKQVPMQAFFTNLDRWLASIIEVLTTQIFEPLVLLNWGKAEEFEITTKPLAEQAMEQIQQVEGGGDQPGEAQQPQSSESQGPTMLNPGSPRFGQPIESPFGRRFGLDDSNTAELLVGQGMVQATQLVDAAKRYMSCQKVESNDSIRVAAETAGLNAEETELLVQRMAAAHAPAGGVTVQGKEYSGGQFIPGDVMAKATAEEKAAVEGGGTSEPETSVKSTSFGSAKHDGKQWRQADGSALPEHIAKIRIPPAWKDVQFATDPSSALQVRGRDAKGRVQSVYSAEATMRNAAAKFQRIGELRQKREAIAKQIDEAISQGNEEATVMSLIMDMGLRPGSSRDTKAEKQAFGATTLEGRHVVQTKSGVRLQFTGKKGVSIDLPVENETLADELMRRAALGSNKKLFETNDTKLRSYAKTLNGGSFKPKDFRTLKGTSVAAELVKADPIPSKDMKEHKSRLKQVATAVSQLLGNTPAIALASYIDPTIFSQWSPQ